MPKKKYEPTGKLIKIDRPEIDCFDLNYWHSPYVPRGGMIPKIKRRSLTKALGALENIVSRGNLYKMLKSD
ncbi:MAG TPA: hypothetical protein VK452_03615 [Dissulfurispiraceae bacterium]|nr:hypothetical protein [Dissulfurispiraceae bacterium]